MTRTNERMHPTIIAINPGTGLQAVLGDTSRPITMTSLELVDYINSVRAEGEPELLHKNFLAKVPQVLGEETSAKFLADLPDSYGRPRRGYRLPKREACLMAMSYSYELQAKVYDHMTALEHQLTTPALPDFTNPVAAARAWADQYEKLGQAAIAQQHLTTELTKTVQHLSRFKDGRGCGKERATINEVTKATGIQYGFWSLKKWCDENSAEREVVYLTAGTFTYSYPSKAWLDVHGVDLNQLFGPN